MSKIYIPGTAVLSVRTHHLCDTGRILDIQKQFVFEVTAQNYTTVTA